MQEKKPLKIVLLVIAIILILLVLWVGIIVGIKFIKKEPITIKDAFNINSIKTIFNKSDEDSKKNTNTINEENTTSRRPDAGSKPEEPEEKNVEVTEYGTKINKSEQVSKQRKIDGLDIKNIRITGKDNQTYVTAEITNNTNKKRGGYGIDITILDDDGETMAIIGGYIDEIEPGKSTILYTTSTLDYTNAHDIKMEKTK